jgi:hypothetical protein
MSEPQTETGKALLAYDGAYDGLTVRPLLRLDILAIEAEAIAIGAREAEVHEAWRHQMARLVNNEERRKAAMDVIVRSRIQGLDMWLAELLTAGAFLAEPEAES